MYRLRIILLLGLLFIEIPAKLVAAEIVQTLFDTTLNTNAGADGWHAERNCKAVLKEQLLLLESTGQQPQIAKFIEFTGGEFCLAVEIRTGTESQASLYWTSKGSPRRDETNKVVVPLQEDGDWHAYEFVFTVPDILEGITLRFSAHDGSWEIRSMKLIRKSPPPFSIQQAIPIIHKEEGKPDQERMKFVVANDLLAPIKYHWGNQTEEQTLEHDQTIDLGVLIKPEGNLAAVVLTLHPQGFPSQVSPVFMYRPEGKTDWIQKPLGEDKILDIAPDGRMAQFRHNGEIFGIIAPLVHRNGIIPKFTLADDSTETELHFEHDEVDLYINIVPPLLNFEIIDKLEQNRHSREGENLVNEVKPNSLVPRLRGGDEPVEPLEGLAVRLFGTLYSGLLPGVEFLRPGDTSSSEIDIEKPYHNRSIPNPLWITMPFVVLETDKGAAALYWDDLSLQPTLSSPNRFDYADDHRFSLIGSHIKASLELRSPSQPKDESASFRVLRSYIAQKGFPPPPPAPRTVEEQRQLFVQALEGTLQSEMGGQWGYAVEPQWERKPFADMLSTSARLSEAAGGRPRNPSALVPGGSDITNDAVFFLSGRIPEWQRNREAAIQKSRATVNANGSLLFRTRFPEWETAASSYGYTAEKSLEIMEYVRATGNNELFAVVTKALDYLEACDIPGGGFYADTPFHTPDLQAAAMLVWLYVWAFEYSGNEEYLERAKHFAFAGLPFVFQTTQKEHMLYGTVGKFGGTNRRPPLHFGVLSTRVGIQYAYALNMLSKHDMQTDWKTVALGILHTAEQLQYTEGSAAGCIPELFDVISQERQGWTVNPCALVSLRWAIEGKVDSLFVFLDGKDRYVAPYPLRRTPKGIEAYDVPSGQKFHLLLNTRRYGTGEGNGLIIVE